MHNPNATMEEKKKFVMDNMGTFDLTDQSDECIAHMYRAMTTYDLDAENAVRWAWLNTLFGYDIGAERAASVISWLDNLDLEALELEGGNTSKNLLSDAAK